MNLTQIRERRTEIERVAGSYGARNLRVFGSVARGESNSDSDLDLLVKFESGRSLLDQAGLQLDLADLLGCKVDVVSEGALTPNHRILLNAVAL